MSETTASLERKIRNVKALQSVVRTMKAMAGSNVSHYENAVRALADYHGAVERGLSVTFRRTRAAPHTGGVPPRTAPPAVSAIVFGSDQGLVGQFNERMADYALAQLALLAPTSSAPRLWAVGERLHARLTDVGVQASGLFAVPTSVRGIAPLVSQIQRETEPDEDERSEAHVYVFYQRHDKASSYTATHQRLLPLDDTWRADLASRPWPNKCVPDVMHMGAATLRTLIREYLFISLYRACAESLASENASRLAAMERADRNIDELLLTLGGTFHQLRQAGIDEELFDVIAGYEALRLPR